MRKVEAHINAPLFYPTVLKYQSQDTDTITKDTTTVNTSFVFFSKFCL